MIIYMPEYRVKGTARRLRKLMQELEVDAMYTECLHLSAQLLGFDSWEHYRERDLLAPLSPLDERLSEEEFSARDEFQMNILVSAGLGSIARELLDRANPTGYWSKKPPESAHGQGMRLDEPYSTMHRPAALGQRPTGRPSTRDTISIA